MPADRYDLALSTVSEAARDAYVQRCELGFQVPAWVASTGSST